jgi:hypothetical protein
MGKPGRDGNGSQPQGGQQGGQPQTPSYTSGKTTAGSGGAYDFADNLDALTTVINELTTAQTELSADIEAIYGILSGKLHEAWSGEVYNAFLERCNFYHPALDELVSLIGTFESLFTSVHGEAEGLNSDVASKLTIS